MVVGTIVGASIFVQPSEVSRAVPSFSGMLLVWVVAGALTWFGASICAELTSACPRTGGVYVFLREMFSPAAGFLWGWAMFWSMHSGIIAAIAMVFGRYAATIVPIGDLGIRLTAVAGIMILSAINYFGVKPGQPCADRLDHRQSRRDYRFAGTDCSALERRGCQAEDRRLRSVAFCGRWLPACSPSVGGTWSPTPPKRRATRSGPFRAP